MRKLIYGLLSLAGLYGLMWLNYMFELWTGFTLTAWAPTILITLGLVYFMGSAVEYALHGKKDGSEK